MKTDVAIVADGMAVLQAQLGIVEAEKFISIISREKLDYTAWRRQLWQDRSLEDIYHAAAEFFEHSDDQTVDDPYERARQYHAQKAPPQTSPKQ